jgi:glycosyltransferase involved in cell wall biosynthesis
MSEMKEVKIGKDKISVALCTYNGEKFIREQLRSIVGQTILPWQIVVCDDQSTDRTMDIVREFADDYPSIRWMIIRNEVRLGVRRNFEKAIALAEGDYIAPSDQNDIWERNKLEILLHIMREKKVSLVHSNIRYVDVKGREMTERLDFPCSVPLATYLYGLNNVMGCTCLFCASLKDILFPFPIHYYYHDQWLAIMAYHNGGIYLCDHKLVRYRQHADNVVSAICGGGKREGEELGLSYFVGKAEDIYILLHRRKQIKYSQKDWWRLAWLYVSNRLGLAWLKFKLL